MLEKNTRRGFTLIELLVVVLIIGILAAVAVPQYQRAVEKARMTEAIVNVRAIANAHQLYYLANGEYLGPDDMEKLDVEISGILDNKRVRTRDFVYSPNGQGGAPGTYSNRLALGWRVKDGNTLYKIYVDQNEPGRIRCSDDDLHVASAIQLKLCSELDEKGTL